MGKACQIVSFIWLWFTDIFTTVTTTKMTSETTVTQVSMSSPGDPKLRTEVSFNVKDFNISQSTTITTERNLNVKSGKHLIYNSVLTKTGSTCI